jgi:RNA polymerase sigma factor (TIGR02999 family)
MTQSVSRNVPQRQLTALRDIDVWRMPPAVPVPVDCAAPADHQSPACDGRICCNPSGGAWAAGIGSPRDPLAGARAAGTAPACEVLVNDVDDSVTGLIRAWSAGDDVAGDRLFSRVYAELRSIARRAHRRVPVHGDDTLDTTALVHEVFLRLAGATELNVKNRAHFFAVVVRASRQIISNYARDAQTLKRGGSAVIEPLDTDAALRLESNHAADALADRVSTLENALQQLELLHPRPCRVVECRYFGGLSITDTALALDISEATVKRDWAVAQAWLHRALRAAGETGDQ